MDSIRTLQLLRGDTDSTRSMGTTLGTIACREEGGGHTGRNNPRLAVLPRLSIHS